MGEGPLRTQQQSLQKRFINEPPGDKQLLTISTGLRACRSGNPPPRFLSLTLEVSDVAGAHSTVSQTLPQRSCRILVIVLFTSQPCKQATEKELTAGGSSLLCVLAGFMSQARVREKGASVEKGPPEDPAVRHFPN